MIYSSEENKEDYLFHNFKFHIRTSPEDRDVSLLLSPEAYSFISFHLMHLEN